MGSPAILVDPRTRLLACLALSLSVSLSFFPSKSTEVGITMDNDLNATYEACNNFNTKLKDTIMGLINANSDRKSEIDGLRGDHDKLRSDHDAFVNSMERENDLRKNEIKSLEERTQKDNQARITDIAKLDGKLDSENSARKSEIQALDSFAKGENDARKTEIANLDNFAHSENDARKTEIANLDNFAKSENDGRKADIAAVNQRLDAEQNARDSEDKALNERITKEISDREAANAELLARMMKENAFLKSLADKSLGVFFDAYRTKAYDGGGEENLTFNGTYCNVGGGFDADTGIFTAPCGGSYMFMFHIATHDNKKALLSIRKNGEEIASIFDQNHKDNHKNSMAGQNIIINVNRGDEIVVYAYTGTWLADFPMNHHTHWVGILLKPNVEEANLMRKQIEEGIEAPVEANGF